MIGVKVSLKFLWGYSVRIAPQGKGRSAYRIPPPTTFLGAYIAGIQQTIGDTSEVIVEGGKKPKYYSAADKYRNLFDDVFVKIEEFNGKIYGEPIKQKYLYRGEVRDNVIAMPGVFHQSGIFSVIYAIKEDVLDALSLSKGDIVRGAWAIMRLGAKEGIVIVKDVNIVQLKEDIACDGMTYHSFYLDEGIEIKGKEYWAERVVYWKTRSFRFGDYSACSKGIVIYPKRRVSFTSEKELPVFRLNDEVLLRTAWRD